MVTFLVMRGFSLREVVDLDFVSFRSLYRSASRVAVTERLQDFETIGLATNGTKQAIRDFVDRLLSDVVEDDSQKRESNVSSTTQIRLGAQTRAKKNRGG